MPPDALLSPAALARRTGLTVRALHHYDAIGLLRATHRTAAGHRRYADADVARLQRITSLRALGLPLGRIAAVLDDPAASPADELARHADALRADLAARQTLLARLDALADALRRGALASTDHLIAIIRLTTMSESHYTPDQLATLKQRYEAHDPAELRAVEDEWPRLIAHVQAARAAGTDPSDPGVQALARRWAELVRAFTGGDPGITQSLKRTFDANPDMAAAQGMDAGLMDYVGRAMAAAGVSL